MKQFIFGLIVGIGLTISWNYFSNPSELNTSTKIATKTKLSPVKVESPSDISKKVQVTLQQKIPANKPNNPSDILTVATTIDSSDELRQQLYDMAANVDDDKLKSAIEMLDTTLQKDPREIFFSEERNNEIATVRENELESSFYEKRPYGGLAKIRSLECKTSLCRVEIELPEGATFNPFPLIRWDGSLGNSYLNPNKKIGEENLMLAFFNIEGRNLDLSVTNSIVEDGATSP